MARREENNDRAVVYREVTNTVAKYSVSCPSGGSIPFVIRHHFQPFRCQSSQQVISTGRTCPSKSYPISNCLGKTLVHAAKSQLGLRTPVQGGYLQTLLDTDRQSSFFALAKVPYRHTWANTFLPRAHTSTGESTLVSPGPDLLLPTVV
jgi:hypothetical protein